MVALEVANLVKKYPSFTLDNVAFSLREGTIMGFIGRNGAGKTTTLKSLMNMVHPDAGTIRFFGRTMAEDEAGIKQAIGFVSGGANYYPKKKLRRITKTTRGFYRDWDDNAYARYCERFMLDQDKTPEQLSAGMNVKYALALALSHNAKLLILDEPTSGLDPVSRDDLLDVFMALVKEGKSILFSTHITSDLDRCADDITYIQNGRILASESIDAFVNGYRLARFDGMPAPDIAPVLIGVREEKRGATALMRASDADATQIPTEPANLEDIMIHLERGAQA